MTFSPFRSRMMLYIQKQEGVDIDISDFQDAHGGKTIDLEVVRKALLPIYPTHVEQVKSTFDRLKDHL